MPYVNLTKTLENRLDTFIRKATKLALAFPINASNNRLDGTGTIYKVEKVIAVHRYNQLRHLESTKKAGCFIVREF